MKNFLLGTALTLAAAPALAAEQCHVAWSHYVGWEPAGYIQDSGIAATVGERHGVDLKFLFINDYVATLEQTSAGAYQAVTSTTIDALAFLAAAGVEAQVIVIGDYSNGNDAILIKDSTGSVSTPADLVGRDINLYELTISDYLFERWLAMHGDGVSYSDFNVVNTTDADIGNVFATGPEGVVAVTWNPIVMEMLGSVEGTQVLFDSSKIPGEILDAVVARADTSEACKAAIVDAWYQGMAIMSGDGQASAAAIASMANFASGGTMGDDAVAWFQAQLATTNMFYDPADAAAVAHSDDLKQATGFVFDFVTQRGLLNAPVGIRFPDGTIVGDETNVMLHFDPSFTERVAAGKL